MRRRIALTLALGTRLFAGDWLTFGHDPQRTGWAFEETVLRGRLKSSVPSGNAGLC